MHTVVIEPEYEAWRAAARQLLAQGVPPEEVLWTDDRQEASLFVGEEPAEAAAVQEQGDLISDSDLKSGSACSSVGRVWREP